MSVSKSEIYSHFDVGTINLFHQSLHCMIWRYIVLKSLYRNDNLYFVYFTGVLFSNLIINLMLI